MRTPRPDLPTGTVTFLFTDIEGSTTRWEQQPAAMTVVLAVGVQDFLPDCCPVLRGRKLGKRPRLGFARGRRVNTC